MAELGNKFECAECGTKFYDLGNPNAVCPKCGTAPNRDAGEVERRPPPPRARVQPEEEETEVAAVEADDEDVEDSGDEIEDVDGDADSDED